MTRLFKPAYGFLAAVVAVCALAVAIPAPQARAATPNYGVQFPVQVIPLHISGQYIATTAAVAKWNLPFKGRVIGVSATARASGGTSPTLTVDVLSGSTPASILSGPISITAGTVSEGTVSTAAIADETPMQVNLTIGGTSPTWNDITVLITVVRE